MSNIIIRRAAKGDMKRIDELLFQVHKVHSDARPDIFRKGAKKIYGRGARKNHRG